MLIAGWEPSQTQASGTEEDVPVCISSPRESHIGSSHPPAAWGIMTPASTQRNKSPCVQKYFPLENNTSKLSKLKVNKMGGKFLWLSYWVKEWNEPFLLAYIDLQTHIFWLWGRGTIVSELEGILYPVRRNLSLQCWHPTDARVEFLVGHYIFY